MSERVIGIVGAGIGGLTAALALRRLGQEAVVFEQAPGFGRVGADINLTPNAVRALDALGVGDALRGTAARPSHRISRTWDSGEETSRIEMGDVAEQKYGSPQLTIHRADLMEALETALPAEAIRFDHRLTDVHQNEAGVSLAFGNGESRTVDVLVGADGIHSAVRTALFGQESPTFTGVVAYRAVVPADRLAGVPNLGAFTKWWGPAPEIQIVTFPLNRGKDIFIFATTPQESWTQESWTTPGSVDELREMYRDFHPEARALLEACDSVLKSALYVRDPLSQWSVGAATLIGDAAHPMMPFMAQGAAMSIEDAVVFSRAVADPALDVATALDGYESVRRPRASRIQLGSRDNTWLKTSADADWVYGYDAWTAAL